MKPRKEKVQISKVILDSFFDSVYFYYNNVSRFYRNVAINGCCMLCISRDVQVLFFLFVHRKEISRMCRSTFLILIRLAAFQPLPTGVILR